MRKLRTTVAVSITAAMGLAGVMITSPAAWAIVPVASCRVDLGTAGMSAVCEASPNAVRARNTVVCQDVDGVNQTVTGPWTRLSVSEKTTIILFCPEGTVSVAGSIEFA
ncbi:hypothetical protein [Kitasatospora sp. NPDC089509]|uniref:hypothetical protein n=1 Tax=Kitasatospora sp. NPDC089509 TaxID=3364079 RepID=UPI00380A927F